MTTYIGNRNHGFFILKWSDQSNTPIPTSYHQELIRPLFCVLFTKALWPETIQYTDTGMFTQHSDAVCLEVTTRGSVLLPYSSWTALMKAIVLLKEKCLNEWWLFSPSQISGPWQPVKRYIKSSRRRHHCLLSMSLRGNKTKERESNWGCDGSGFVGICE